MLADLSDTSTHIGAFARDVHLPATSRYELLEFIATELPRWRDRTDRKAETSETVLTSQLCAHLNSAARHSNGWDILQFRCEEPDELNKTRKIDLVPAPCGTAICIEGRRHTDFDPILPIECKRLPTPAGDKRDEREYVVNRHASTGGIQRFKFGLHGGAHTLGAMIGYLQEDAASIWNERVEQWIQDLVDSGEPGWTSDDFLHLEREAKAQRLTVFRSLHARGKALQEIELRHLWLQMN
jgi:hypothetical protein